MSFSVFPPVTNGDDGTWVVLTWWAVITAFGALNIGAWFYLQSTARLGTDKRQIWLAGVYTVVCAFRSVVPRADAQRLCLWDHWLSSIFLGRTVATVAEMAFAAQWALLLLQAARASQSNLARTVALALVPVIGLAEVFSWAGVLTSNFLWHTLEEFLWLASFLAVFLALIAIRDALSPHSRRNADVMAVGTMCYVLFMSFIDVPMYWYRYVADEAAHATYRTAFFDGVWDALERRHVSQSFADWEWEMPWMAGYFTLAVWGSLAIMYAPAFAVSRTLREAKRQ